MSTEGQQTRPATIAPPPRPLVYEESGAGRIKFAGTMLLILGVINCIGGIAAIGDSKFFAGAAQYMVGDLNSLGWVVLVAGAIQVVAGLGIWARSFPAIWLGVVSAGLNAIAQLLFLPAQPLWSIAIFAVDVGVLHVLITNSELD